MPVWLVHGLVRYATTIHRDESYGCIGPKAWKKDDSIVQHQSRLGQEGFSETVDVAAYP
jgi:hypothetical protein